MPASRLFTLIVCSKDVRLSGSFISPNSNSGVNPYRILEYDEMLVLQFTSKLDVVMLFCVTAELKQISPSYSKSFSSRISNW